MVIRASDYVEERMLGPAAMGRANSRPLSAGTIYRQDGHAVVGSGGLLRQERAELPTHTRSHYDKLGLADTSTLLSEAGVGDASDREFYRLTDEHTYYVEFDGDLSIPEGHVGLVRPQENLLRAGVLSDAAPVGPEEDTAEALVHVKANDVLVDEAASIAELVVVAVGDADAGE